MSTEIKICLGTALAGSQRPRAAGRWRTKAAQAGARTGPGAGGGSRRPHARPPPPSTPPRVLIAGYSTGTSVRGKESGNGRRGREVGNPVPNAQSLRGLGGPGAGSREQGAAPPFPLVTLHRLAAPGQGSGQRSTQATGSGNGGWGARWGW